MPTLCRISGVHSSSRRCIAKTATTPKARINTGRSELDSHADTVCVGSGWEVVSTTSQVADVGGFHDGFTAVKNVPIVTARTSVDIHGELFIVVVHHALWFGDQLKVSLLANAQLRAGGCKIDDVPCHIEPSSTHSIHVPTGAADEFVSLPLSLVGTFSGFDCRVPTRDDVESCRHLHLTRPEGWDPSTNVLAEKEENYLRGLDDPSRSRLVSAVASTFSEHDFVDTYDDTDDLAYDFYTKLSITHLVSATKTMNPRSKWTPAQVSERFGTSLETSRRTLEATTQNIMRESVYSNSDLVRRMKTHHPDYRHKQIGGQFYADVAKAGVRSVHQEQYATIFCNDKNYTRFYPIERKSQVDDTLDQFIREVGVMDRLLTDNAPEFVGKNALFDTRCRKLNITRTFTEPHSPWQNRAEISVKETFKGIRRRIRKTGAHPRLWNYAGKWESEIRNLTCFPSPKLQGRTPYEIVHGETPDISQYLEFSWYDKCRYLDRDSKDSDPMKPGRILGVAHHHGTMMVYFVLAKSGRVIATSTVNQVPRHEATSELWTDYDKAIKDYLGAGTQEEDGLPFVVPPDVATQLMNDHDEHAYWHEPEASAPDREDVTPEELDNYINGQIMFPSGDLVMRGTVRRRKRNPDGELFGVANDNPRLDSREYVVEFEDGHEEEFMANTVAENIYAQSNAEGFDRLILAEIVDHKIPDWASADSSTGDPVTSKKQNRVTKGHKLLVTFKNGETVWSKLSDMKREFPVETAEYAIAMKLDKLPGFRWWVHQAIGHKNRIVSKVRSKYWSSTHKFGVELPKTIDDCKRLDTKNGNTLWMDAVRKEMKGIDEHKTFEILEAEQPLPVGYQLIKCHLVFDVKLGTLQRKARFVADGYMVDRSSISTYSSVVSRDTVRLFFLIAALNGLTVKAADISNAFLNAPPKEKCYFIAGDELGERHNGKRVVVRRALYGLPGAASAFRNVVCDTLKDPGAGFENCVADPDAWRRPAIKKDGTPYYEYVMVYVDDLLICSEDTTSIEKIFLESYELKKDKETGKQWMTPDKYLGANIEQWKAPGDSEPFWAMSAREYIVSAVKNVEEYLGQRSMSLQKCVTTPITPKYRPELDETPELDADDMRYYQELMGVLRWIVECGRIDILHDVSLLSKHNCMPRQGHLEQAFRVFAYLKHNSKKKIVFDPHRLEFADKQFTKVDWSDVYPDAKDELPPGMPEPRGASVQVNVFVDADHAGDRVNRRSHTGVLIFVNKAPIVWYSKKQNTVETSTFGSEYVALRIATELTMGLRYKLRMMGVPLEGPANIFVDNKSVATSASVPESTLKKKHNAICFHMVREACASGAVRIAWEPTEYNLADALTKTLPEVTRNKLFSYMKNRSEDE